MTGMKRPPPHWQMALLALMALSVLACMRLGYRVNFTRSEPVGIWRLEPVSYPLRKGDHVVFCAPLGPYGFLARGCCPDGTMPLLKTVVGVPGDRILTTASGIAINGQVLPASSPLQGAPDGLPRFLGPLSLPKDNYWVYGAGAPTRSFDSRYWGPVRGLAILFTARPVLIWHSTT